MSILVVAEHQSSGLHLGTYAAVSAARQLSNDIHILIAGYQCEKSVAQASKIKDIKKVYYADDMVYEHMFAETLSPLIKELASTYTHIISPSSSLGRNVLPRLAGELNVECLTDVVQIVSNDTFVRPVFSGNALVTVQMFDPVKLLTVRMSAFDSAVLTQESAPVFRVEKINNDIRKFSEIVNWVSEESFYSNRPDLVKARVVISAGRAVQSSDSFSVLENIAIKLNAAIGASKPAVDAGLISHNRLVGQTGKMVAPELYIAVGISGASQHIAGMKESKVIVAINKDKNAPIFEIADYGLVGDLFDILPELDKALEKLYLEKLSLIEMEKSYEY